MEAFIQSLGTDIWLEIITSYKLPDTPPTGVADKKLYESNAKSKNAILSGLVESKFMKVMQCNSTK